MATVLFFTSADRQYEDYAPLYAFSILSHVKDSVVEVGVEDDHSFRSRHGAAWAHVGACFGRHKLIVRSVPWALPHGRSILPNTVRFLVIPKLRAGYVYIGDIDIIILDRQLLSMHLNHMKTTGLPYSNSVRPRTTRMSGLHFSRFDAYYPVPDVSDLDLGRMNDEMVLYEIIKRKRLELQNRIWYRPVHGIHISPNRAPEALIDHQGRVVNPGWGISFYARQWSETAAEPRFQELRGLLSARVRDALRKIDRTAARVRSQVATRADPRGR
jgi:hypothetical protein